MTSAQNADSAPKQYYCPQMQDVTWAKQSCKQQYICISNGMGSAHNLVANLYGDKRINNKRKTCLFSATTFIGTKFSYANSDPTTSHCPKCFTLTAYFGWFLVTIIFKGGYFESCMGRFKRWRKHWTCDNFKRSAIFRTISPSLESRQKRICPSSKTHNPGIA